jgi:uncharacterized protein YkuJ
MNDYQPIISVKEAREILGNDAIDMSDDELLAVINTLDLLAKDALDEAKRRIRMKKDAKELAEVIYSVYKDDKHLKKPKS